jgi:hypothetical protein
MKPLNKLVVIAWRTPRKCVRVLIGTMCTTLLTVMSGIEPHMISETLDGFWLSFWLGRVEVAFTRLWVSHGETPWRDRDHYL